MRTTLLGALFFALVVGVVPARAADTSAIDAAMKTFESKGDSEARIKAGVTLARKAPEKLRDAANKIVGAKHDGDEKILAGVAVRVKVPDERLYLVWSASHFKGGVSAFSNLIDNDHPKQTMRALEALGFLRDPSTAEKLILAARSENELVAVEAARALARVGTRKNVKAIVDLALGIQSTHVRQHLAWALRDILGSGKSAMGLFLRYKGQPNTKGYRAKEVIATLDDDRNPPQQYRVKLSKVNDFFGRRASRTPPVSGPHDYKPGVENALKLLEKEAPDWHHLISGTVRSISISGNPKIFDFNRRTLNLPLSYFVNWKDSDGKLRPDIVSFYLIRFTTILFYGRMGDPTEGHRGWEEGIMAGWWYAMDYTKIAVNENELTYLKSILNAKPPPW